MQKIKILFDARYIKEPYTGIARFIHSLLTCLVDNYRLHLNITILLDSNISYDDNYIFLHLRSLEANRFLSIIYLDSPHNSFRQFLSFYFLDKSHFDLFLYPHYDLPFPVKIKTIFVIHDLNPIVQNKYYINLNYFKKFIFSKFISFSLYSKKTRCVAISNNTKSDLIKFKGVCYNDKIYVIPSGLSQMSNLVSRPKMLSLNDSPFLLYVGDRRGHKNIKKMIDIFIILKKVHSYSGRLLIVGSVRNYDFNLDDYVAGCPAVKLLGPVNDAELSWLYQKMDAFMFISTYEGFGLPIVEAAYFNKKIITSNVGSCNEIAPESALKIDPHGNNYLISLEIIEYLSKPLIIDNSSYLEYYSWQRAAISYFKLISEFLNVPAFEIAP
jgi:glycosyltransferase involved in cell wall biosynthesis